MTDNCPLIKLLGLISMAHLPSNKYVSTAIIFVAVLMCILNYLISDYMVELSLSMGGFSMTASEILDLNKVEEMLPRIFHRYTRYISAPGGFSLIALMIAIYNTPAIAIFLVRKWILMQLIVMAEIVALLIYSISKLLTVQMAVANGCPNCEDLFFAQSLISFSIYLSSLTFFSIANYIEEKIRNREA